jgi:anti-sigma regulatory factor (Ser/Thr protein kinase)
MTDDPQIKIELRSNPLFLSGVRELVSSVAKRIGFNEMNCCQIALAVDEALCNVMRHGYQKRTDGMIWLSVWPMTAGTAGMGAASGPSNASSPAQPAIRIVIEDEAPQIDPAQIKGRDLADIKPGGLGVHIIKEVMDSATYEKRDRVGMRLTMMKTQKHGDEKKSDNSKSAKCSVETRGEDGSCSCGGSNG